MGRKKATDNNGDKPANLMQAVRRVLETNPKAKAGEISARVKSEYAMEISPKMAATYRYHIRTTKRGKQRRTLRAAAPAKHESSGVDDLLHAAQKLGWKRVKELVEKVLEVPT